MAYILLFVYIIFITNWFVNRQFLSVFRLNIITNITEWSVQTVLLVARQQSLLDTKKNRLVMHEASIQPDEISQGALGLPGKPVSDSV